MLSLRCVSTPKKEKNIDYPEQLTLDLFPDDPAPSDRPFSSWNDMDLQNLIVIDVHKGHVDVDLKKEFDARMSQAFLDFFENLSPGPDGIRIRLSGGLKQQLRKAADHLNF